MKRSKLMGIAALLLVCLAAPLFAADSNAELLKAARDGDVAAVKSFLAADADASAEKYGYTALMWSAMIGNADIVSELIKAGTNVNAQGYSNYTALIWAAQNGHKDVVSALSVRAQT